PDSPVVDSDFGPGGQSASGALPIRGPEFGRVDEANARRSSNEDGGWMAEFAGELGTRSGGGRRVRGLLPQLLLTAGAIAIIIFAAVMTGTCIGSNYAVHLRAYILPIRRRPRRSITRGNRRR